MRINCIGALLLLLSREAICASVESATWPTARSSTQLLEIVQGSLLSSKVTAIRDGSLTLADGRLFYFSDYYSTRWTDARISWVTAISSSFGIVWGLSTGEKGRKYQIAPSLKIGFVYNADLSATTNLSLTATTVLGGRLKEKSCLVDYGPIAGELEANCRLAASTMPPAETLQHLLNVVPPDRHRVVLTYTIKL